MEYYVLVYIIEYRKLLSKYLNLVFACEYIHHMITFWNKLNKKMFILKKNNSF